MERYRIYVGDIQYVSAKIKYSFCDPTMSRMLVFSSAKPEGIFRIMKERETSTLSDRERLWLSQTRMCVAMNNASQSATELAQNMNELMDTLEEELKREKEELEYGNRKEQPTTTE